MGDKMYKLYKSLPLSIQSRYLRLDENNIRKSIEELDIFVNSPHMKYINTLNFLKMYYFLMNYVPIIVLKVIEMMLKL